MSFSLWIHKLYVTVVTYIPFQTLGLCAAIAIALFCLFFFFHAVIKKEKQFNIIRFASLSCFIAWLYFIADITLLSRLHLVSYDLGINMQLFTPNPEGMFSTIVTALYNALMFAPLPFLLPFIFKFFRKAYITLPLCIPLAFLVEYLQYYFKLGLYELDDFVYYTIGILFGYLLYFPANKLLKKIISKL